jgi:hypothetical protein
MTAIQFEEIINKGIKGLGQKELEEIATYIYFIRKKSLAPKEFELEFFNEEMRLTSKDETTHLETEFKDYKTIYPKI